MTRSRQWIAAALCACLALVAGACDSQRKPPAQAMHALPVMVMPIALHPVSQSTQYVGTLQSRFSATLYPQVTGYIHKIDVHAGDRVKAGQLLMVIDPLKQKATVRSQASTLAAQAALVAYDRQQLLRAQALWKDKVAARQDLDQARSTYAAAQAQLAALRAQLREQQVQLRYYNILAPHSGIIGNIPVHSGDLVTNATLLTTLNQPGNLEAYINVPVERAAVLRPGLPVQLVNSAGKALAQSRISFISPQVNANSQTVLVKATFNDDRGRLRDQQYVEARIVWGTHPAMLAPVLDVSQINGRQFAFIAAPAAKGFIARQVRIHVGAIVGNNYVVESGVRPGDRMIISGTQFLVSGMPVMPIAPPSGAPPRPKS